MPPSLLLTFLLVVPSTWSIANKTPRHVAGGAGYSQSAASSYARSAAYSSGGSYASGGGVKGGCSSCGQAGFSSSASSNSGSHNGGFGNSGSASSFVSAGDQTYPANLDPSNVAFWWAGSDSPFKKAHEFYKKCAMKGDCGGIPGPFQLPAFDPASSPCGSQRCVSQNIESHKPIDIANNPFLNGEFKGISVSACSGSGCPGGKPGVTITNCKGTECKTIKQEGEPSKIDFNANPFLSSVSGGSSFRGSHGAGSDIAFSGKHSGFGSFGSSHEPKPTSSHPQSGQTPSYQDGTTSFGSSSSSSHSYSHGQTYPTASTSFGNTGSFGHSGIGQSGPGCTSSSNCQTRFSTPSTDFQAPNKPDPDYRPGHPQSIPTCYPGQPGCAKSHNKPQSIPTCYPGQPGCSPQTHQQKKPESFPPPYPTSQPAYTSGFSNSGSSGFSSSGSGSTSYSSGPSAHGNYPGSQQGHPKQPEGQLTLRCGGADYICVEKHLCNNGIVNTNGQDLFQARNGEQFCNVNTQVCCRLPQKEPSQQQPNYYQHSSSGAHTSSGASTYFTSSGPAANPTAASQIANQYTPQRTNHPDNRFSSPGQPTSFTPPKDARPGQSIPFGGSPGNSPGVIHVVGDSNYPRPFTSGSGLLHIPPNNEPDSVHIRPHGEGDIPRPFTSSPGFGKNSTNEIGSATAAATASATFIGPPYIPPPLSPKPSSFTPELLPPPSQPSPSSISPSILLPERTTTPRVFYTPPSTTPRVIYTQPSSPRPYPPTPRYTPTPTVYLPPKTTPIDPNLRPEGAGTIESRLRLPTSPRPTTEYAFKGELNTTPYPGCAAALKCVESQFCTADGVMSDVPVILSKEQEIMRVPTTDCADPETGVVGKCCRDPNYVDPWPASQLGLYNPNDGFDNGQYKETRNQGQYKRPTASGVKGGPQPGVKGGRPPSRPYEPNQLGAASNIPRTYVRPDPSRGYPSQVPNVPFDSRLVNKPVQVDIKKPFEFKVNGQHPYNPSKTSSKTCGIRQPGGSPRGQGPIDVDFAEIPWQAMILRQANKSLLCGGVIIRRNAVLTAASCVEGLQSGDVLVKGGEWKLGIDEEPKPFQIIKTAAIVRHPGYNPQTKLNDIAILMLEEKFRIDKNVDTICLPDPDADVESTFQNAKCITTGWGKTVLQIHLLNALMHSVDVGIVPAAQCQQALQQFHSGSSHLYNTNCLCGATTKPNTDMCEVDIGSALACDIGDGHYTLAGIYSWDTGCRTQSQVAGFSKVDLYWIESQLQRPLRDLQTEENGFLQQLVGAATHQHTGPQCHCLNGKK